MDKEETTTTDQRSIPPDYTDSVTGILLLSAFLSTLLIITGRADSLDSRFITDFFALLAASSLIALSDALVLKVFNPFLKSLSTKSSMVAAYVLLMTTTIIICYVLYATVTDHWPSALSGGKDLFSIFQKLLISTVIYIIVLVIR